MNTCPFCDSTPCLPAWRKLMLGPSASARCRVCGLKVTAEAKRAWPAMLPTIAITIAAGLRLITDPVALLVLLVVCLTATALLYMFWVRLVPNQITSAAMLQEAKARAANKT
jgi:hypothetical protein